MIVYKSSSKLQIHICTESNTLIIKKLFTKKEYYLTQIIRVEKINHSFGPNIYIFLPNCVKVNAGFHPTPISEKTAQELFSVLSNYTKVFYISESGKELIIFNKFPNLSSGYQPIITINVEDIVDYRPLHITDLSGSLINAKYVVKLEIILTTKNSGEYTIPYIFKTISVSNPIAIEAYQSYQKDLAFFSRILGKKHIV